MTKNTKIQGIKRNRKGGGEGERDRNWKVRGEKRGESGSDTREFREFLASQTEREEDPITKPIIQAADEKLLIRKSRQTPRVEIYSFVGDAFSCFCAKEWVGGG